MDYRVTIRQAGKQQTTLFVLSVSTDTSLALPSCLFSGEVPGPQ